MASISNNEIKRVKSLQQKKFRDTEGLFIAEGEKMVEEALKSGYQVEQIYRKEDIGEEAMKRISALSSPSPVLAVIRKPADVQISDLSGILSSMSAGGLYLALDSIRDPGNLGTILRIADWFGIDAVFLILWMYSIRKLSSRQWVRYSASRCIIWIFRLYPRLCFPWAERFMVLSLTDRISIQGLWIPARRDRS